MLLPGDPAPWFKAASTVNPKFNFDTAAGRYVVLTFFASSKHPFSEKLLAEVDRRRERFDVTNVVFFGVSVDQQDQQRLNSDWPGIIYFWDTDLAISRQYGVVSEAPVDAQSDDKKASYQPCTFLLDQSLRLLAMVPFTPGEAAVHLDEIFKLIDSLPKMSALNAPAPVLLIPYVFEPQLCKTLIEYYHAHGGEDSGFMRDVGGKTVGVTDYSHKRRADCEIVDQQLIKTTQERLARRIVPAIKQAFQFNATRIERHIVACYDAVTGGHFRAHRDNTTLGTAHRRFAVTINLNTEEFEGGELWFPEFSQRTYRAPTGGAVVFSCSLLHEAAPVTRGLRYAFLPFLYDDAAAKIREQNHKFVAGGAPIQGMQNAAG
jgi:peroxiredoxin/predicted 2-oxoglutarate/Fe(II)-dependent dioxygenase YbiX